MNYFKVILSVVFICSLINCYSQQKQVAITTTTPSVSAPSATTSDVIERPKSFFTAVDKSDISDALELLGINIYSIKLPAINTKKYRLTVYTDNYIQNKETVKRKNEFIVVNEQKDAEQKISLTIVQRGDSTLVIKWKAADGATRSSENPRGRISGYEYRCLPFEFQEIVPGKKIPILLFGSSWFDAKINGVRFCYDFELKPDLSNEAFKDMPQYYIFSIELTEMNN